MNTGARVLRSRDTGNHYRERFAWWAGRNGVLVVEQRQGLTERADGKYEADGKWQTQAAQYYAIAKPAQRRVAVLPVNPHDATTTTADALDNYTSKGLEFLPEAASRALTEHIRHPIHLSAEGIRWETATVGHYAFTVSALCMNDVTG